MYTTQSAVKLYLLDFHETPRILELYITIIGRDHQRYLSTFRSYIS